MELELRVYFDEAYYFISRAPAAATIKMYIQQLQREFAVLFNEPSEILGLQNANFFDLPHTLQVSQVLRTNDSVFVLRRLATTLPQKLYLHVLRLPAIDPSTLQLTSATNPRRCSPYCLPLARFGYCYYQCAVCGEIKAYEPLQGPHCTKFCYSSESRKLKSYNLDFCSICLGRLRSGKYMPNCIHYCAVCHRPWLILNRSGVCRTCHALIRYDYYGDRTSFKPERLIAVGEGAIDASADPLICEARRIGALVLERAGESERIIDKIQYNKGSESLKMSE